MKSAMCAVAAVLLTAGAVDAKITAEFVQTQANVTSEASGQIDVYELQVTGNNADPITGIGKNVSDQLKIVGTLLNDTTTLGGDLEKTFKDNTGLTVFNNPVADTFFVTPQAPPAVLPVSVDTNSELSGIFGVVSGAIIPPNPVDYAIAVISVPVGTPLNISNWGNDVPAISGSLEQVDTITYIPEPASVALLGLGGLALLRRRRA